MSCLTLSTEFYSKTKVLVFSGFNFYIPHIINIKACCRCFEVILVSFYLKHGKNSEINFTFLAQWKDKNNNMAKLIITCTVKYRNLICLHAYPSRNPTLICLKMFCLK